MLSCHGGGAAAGRDPKPRARKFALAGQAYVRLCPSRSARRNYSHAQRPWHWCASEIRVPTLASAARAHGRKTAAVFWPVSVVMEVDFDLPEV